MGSLNKVQLIGRLGRDPELKATPNGNSVASFSIATDDNWTDKSGSRQERTEWHSIVAWGKLADPCAKHLAKGRQVYVEGKLQTRAWADKDGNKRSTTEIVASQVVFLDGGGTRRQASGGTSCDVPDQGITDNDIPF